MQLLTVTSAKYMSRLEDRPVRKCVPEHSLNDVAWAQWTKPSTSLQSLSHRGGLPAVVPGSQHDRLAARCPDSADPEAPFQVVAGQWRGRVRRFPLVCSGRAVSCPKVKLVHHGEAVNPPVSCLELVAFLTNLLALLKPQSNRFAKSRSCMHFDTCTNAVHQACRPYDFWEALQTAPYAASEAGVISNAI